MQITLKSMNDDENNQNGTFQNINHEQNHRLQRLKELEGECKVHSFRPLQFDSIKAALLIFPLIFSFIGLLLLKYFKTFRVRCFYKDSSHEQATYFFIQSTDGHEQIEEVIRQNGHLVVYFKNLKYRFTNSDLVPVGYQFEENFGSLSSNEYLSMGLSESIRSNNQKIFGRNEHIVEIPNYLEYMFDILTKPFFLFQYAICIIYAFQRLYLYTGIYLGFSFFTTTINYILLYRSYTKIKEMAQKETDVTVIREGVAMKVKNHGLVPGDIAIPAKNEEISYDGILLTGEVFVNEASLTGESIPVGKFPALTLDQTKKDTAWIVEGSKVLQAREQSRVVIVNIGYATRRGRIIRKILTRVPKVADFFLSGVYFLVQTCIVAMIIFACTVNMMVVNNIIPTFIVFRFLDFLVWSFPPSFPIYFNVANTFSLVRLKWRNIFGTEPEKATEAANIRTFCFDKTGTLTQNEIEVYEVIKFTSQTAHNIITTQLNNSSNSLISKLFASCHTTRQVQDGLLGDQVDLRMYLHSQYKMSVTNDPAIRFIVENNGERIEVLRINQFQSKFQNMSVFVRDAKQSKYYVFVKGAPERIEKNSKAKFNYFQTIVSNLSLGGYRTIGYGYKQISEGEKDKYLQAERDIFEKDIIALGVVAFENKLKPDTRDTIERLNQSDIEPKMITGDNIFIAVQTGFRAGILKEGEKVILLQGRKQANYSKGQYEGLLLFKNDGEITQQKIQIRTDEYETTNEYAFAIDNDFLVLKPQPVLTKTTKLFARISPQNKAFIVKKFKQQEQFNFSLLPWKERAFGSQKWKVGMCGDGANDLMAIRQADVGIGISDSDASYGASFTIGKLSDTQHLVRESKNTSQSIVDVIRYFGTINFLKIITSIILAADVTYFNSNEVVYFNFAHSLWIALFIVMSSTAEQPSKERPNTNILSFQNHVIYWSNIIFPTIGFFGAYYYLYASSIFVSNPIPVVTADLGYNGLKCYTNTMVWLLINLPLVFNAIIIYKSDPFKSKYYQNIPLLVITALNAILAIAFFFIIKIISKPFGLIDVPVYQSGICLLIMLVTLIASYIFNKVFIQVRSK